MIPTKSAILMRECITDLENGDFPVFNRDKECERCETFAYCRLLRMNVLKVREGYKSAFERQIRDIINDIIKNHRFRELV